MHGPNFSPAESRSFFLERSVTFDMLYRKLNLNRKCMNDSEVDSNTWGIPVGMKSKQGNDK